MDFWSRVSYPLPSSPLQQQHERNRRQRGVKDKNQTPERLLVYSVCKKRDSLVVLEVMLGLIVIV